MLKSISFIFLALTLLISCSNESTSEVEEGAESRVQTGKSKTEDSRAVSDGHNSQNSLDWEGTYSGVLPCDDCEGVETTITLKGDEKYSRKLVYRGKSKTPLMSAGKFEWNEAGSAVTLLSPSGENEVYRVGENQLIKLDQEGQTVAGDLNNEYTLKKNYADPALEGSKWELVELNGKPVAIDEGSKMPFIKFNAVEARISGNGSCNDFFGTYKLMQGNGMTVGNRMGITKKACPEMNLEDEFVKSLKSIDSYLIEDNSLILKSGETPVAKFRLKEALG